VKHHHILYYLGFLAVSVFVLASGWDAIAPFLASSPVSKDWITPLAVAGLGAYVFLVFGFLSRRCERQADIHGCLTVSCGRPDCREHDSQTLPSERRGLCPTGIRIFISALEKVGAINGMVRSLPKFELAWPWSVGGLLKFGGQVLRVLPAWVQTWQHSTIDWRVEFLRTMEADPTLEPRFQRRIGRVKWGLIIVLICLFGVIKLLPAEAKEQHDPAGVQMVQPSGQ
jgi:hypothetical protein